MVKRKYSLRLLTLEGISTRVHRFLKQDLIIVNKCFNCLDSNDKELKYLLHNFRDVFLCNRTELVGKFR